MTVTIVLADADPRWPAEFARQLSRIEAALGPTAVAVEHVGSTSVPGLAAKPIIDVLLLVSDSRDEDAYVPPLERAGFRFHLREPDWHEHRLLKGVDPDVNLHVFTEGSAEAHRMLAFRDHLRADPTDRARYEQAKRELSTKTWGTVQDYADAKTDVVTDIMQRALQR